MAPWPFQFAGHGFGRLLVAASSLAMRWAVCCAWVSSARVVPICLPRCDSRQPGRSVFPDRGTLAFGVGEVFGGDAALAGDCLMGAVSLSTAPSRICNLRVLMIRLPR